MGFHFNPFGTLLGAPVSLVTNLQIRTTLIYMYDPFLDEKPQKFLHATFLVSSYFTTHPITLLLEILGGRMHGPSPNLHFGGRPSSPPKSPPVHLYTHTQLPDWSNETDLLSATRLRITLIIFFGLPWWGLTFFLLLVFHLSSHSSAPCLILEYPRNWNKLLSFYNF